MIVRRVFAGLLSAVLLTLVSACTPKLGDFYTPKILAKQLRESGGWALLPFPDSKYEPGSIVKITEVDGIRWVSHLRSCNVPDDVLKPVPSDIPPLDLNRKTEFTGTLALKYQGIEVGPEYSKETKVQLKINKMTSGSIDLIKLSDWLNDPQNAGKLSDACRTYLALADHYFENEGLAIEDGSFALYDKDNKKIALKADQLGKYFGGSFTAGLGVENDGSVKFTKPYFLAIRKAQRKGSFIETMSPEAKAVKKPTLPGDAVLFALSEKY